MRLIDADKMKETLISGTKNKFVFVCLSRVLEKIDNAPTVEIGEDGIDIEKYSDKLYKIAYEKGKAEAERPQGEWIPVSERLPERANKSYLVTLDYGDLGICVGHKFYFGDGIGWDNPCVIAWQPLPEPYKKGEEE